MAVPLILYSTNTWLAFNVAQRYYGQVHYVWCTPHFDVPSRRGAAFGVAPTSAPMEIYRNLAMEVALGDLHSAKVEANRSGILTGASAKLSAGTISAMQETEIRAIAARAQVQDFRPLLYVIPRALVASRLVPVPVDQRAHPLSEEYILTDLRREEFDVIEFRL